MNKKYWGMKRLVQKVTLVESVGHYFAIGSE
jgi:hypothetical protein